MTQRLQKVLAHVGIASRRQAEQLILGGRVRVNGILVTQLGTKVDPAQDQIEVDGRQITWETGQGDPILHQTILINKPQGVLSTCFDPQGRMTVLDLIPPDWLKGRRFYPIGRLDGDSTGALLLTNDGDLTLQLTHPRYHVPKTYCVEVMGNPSEKTLQQWREGVDLEGSLTLPAQVYRHQKRTHPVLNTSQSLASLDPLFFRKIKSFPPGRVSELQRSRTTLLTVVLHEGRKRQIRRVAEQLGHPVVALHREAIGSLRLGDLRLGQFRLLRPSELSTLKRESLAGHVT